MRKWWVRLAVVVVAVIAVLVILPFFISLNDYIPRIEKEMSARLGEPVKIGGLRLGLLPLPHATAHDIAIGKARDLKVGKVSVTPELLSLLGSPKIIRNVQVNGLELTQRALDSIPAWTQPAAKPAAPPQVVVRAIHLDDALFRLDKANFGPFDARVRLDGAGNPQDVSITTRDGKFKAHVTPGASSHQVEIAAQAWKLPAGPPILFDALNVKGVATAREASFSQISARLYGGSVNGKASVSWQKGLQFKGNLDISRVELKPLVPLLVPGKNMSGKLDARPAFSANAASASQVVNAMRLETPFSVHDGVLYGVDIQKAATNLIKQGGSGGETRFEELSGHMVMAQRGYRFTGIRISSGALSADGNVGISPGRELSGRINARVQTMGAGANVPLNVAGTVDAPLLYPTGGTVTGAAVGTAILGPGVGTSLGAKIGGWAENLFGGKDEKRK